MYLKELRIWNFRKFPEKEDGSPGLIVQFNERFNLLIGENDSGKTAIIDAIHFTLGASSIQRTRISEKDFYSNGSVSKNDFKIECTFSKLSEEEAGVFLEWISFDANNEYELIVRLTASKVKNKFATDFIERNIKAGPVNADFRLEGLAREIVNATYLKPLRDAEGELRPGIKSRLAQILKAHSLFKTEEDGLHRLESIMLDANSEMQKFFETPYGVQEKTLLEELSYYLKEFFSKETLTTGVYNPKLEVSTAKLNVILNKLSLELEDNASGLGSLNLLFIATELLLLNDKLNIGPGITLIEEIEAHLHPQAQLRLIHFLQENAAEKESKGQFILSTHSPTLAASTTLENLILVHQNNVYPMNSLNTNLEKEDYKFLERFLDATKSNLFFARGVILVEGDAENLLLPAIAEVIDRPLHKYGVSIVNLGSTAFKRYAKIFTRSKVWLEQGFPELSLPVSLITDSDVKPLEYYQVEGKTATAYLIGSKEVLFEVMELYNIEQEEDEDKEYDEVIGQSFTTLKKMKEALNDIFILNNTKDTELEKLTEVEIKERFIQDSEVERMRILKSQYENENSKLKVFVARHWTLEYMLALSSIREDFAKVVHNSRYKYPESNSNSKKLEKIINGIKEGSAKEEIAYEIFKALNNKNVSKAVVAQNLAEVLLEDKEKFNPLIKSDPFMRYLVEAIYHVTEQKEDDLEVNSCE